MEGRGDRNLKLLNKITFFKSFNTFDAVLAIYFSQITESFASAMFVLSLVSLSAAIFEVPTGVFSDNIGRKKTLLIHYATAAIAVIFYYYADSVYLLAFGAIILGFSLAMRSGTMQAFVYENLELQDKTSEFLNYEGSRRSIERYSLVLASIVGAIIIKYADIRQALIVPIIFRVIAFMLAFRLSDLPNINKMSGNIYAQIKEAWVKFKGNESIKNIGIAKIISQGGGNLEFRFKALFYKTLIPAWLISVLSVFTKLVSAYTMKNANKIIKKFGFMKSLALGEFINRLTSTMLVFVSSYVTPFLMGGVGSAMLGVRVVADEDILQKKYDSNQRATMGSLIGLGSSLFYGVLGIGVGLLADVLGVKVTLLLLQPVLLTSVFFYWKGIKHQQKSI